MSDATSLAEAVLPLQWKRRSATNFTEVWDGNSMIGQTVSVWQENEGGVWFANIRKGSNAFATLELAKAAAQSDYRARIISALNPALLAAMAEVEREQRRTGNWRRDCGILLAQVDHLCNATGENLDAEDWGLVEQIRAALAASQEAGHG